MSTFKEKVAVIILNWNGKVDTLACLNSLVKIQTNSFEPTLIVVDNHSSDNSVTEITKHFPNVEVIANSQNLGFSGGNNVGIKKASEKNYDWVLLLNNDTIVETNFLDNLVVFAKSKPKVGILGPALKFKKGFEVYYDLGGVINTLIGRTTHRQVSLITQTNPRSVDYVSGACMLVRKDVFERIGLLDESYFFGFEDVDFCIQARNAGFGVYLVPLALVEHKISGSLGNSPLKVYYLLRNNLRFIGRRLIFPRNLFGFVYILVLGTKISINHPRFLGAVVAAGWDFLRGKAGEKVMR